MTRLTRSSFSRGRKLAPLFNPFKLPALFPDDHRVKTWHIRRFIMNRNLDAVLSAIGETFQTEIEADARFYREVDIGKQAESMGLADVFDRFRGVSAIVPLRRPSTGMTVRVDGRTFVNYAQFDSGIAVPGYVAAESELPQKPFAANDSMILNFV
jgi:hypothetical protein